MEGALIMGPVVCGREHGSVEKRRQGVYLFFSHVCAGWGARKIFRSDRPSTEIISPRHGERLETRDKECLSVYWVELIYFVVHSALKWNEVRTDIGVVGGLSWAVLVLFVFFNFR